MNTLLIANRGEVAGRIIATCQRLGIRTIALFSEADRDSLHVRLADEAYYLGPARALDSYLNIDAICEIAQRSGAQAVHPGYGFLAENAEFAQRVQQLGLTFVGPRPEIIAQMGCKVSARTLCQTVGVPTVPGSQALSDSELATWAEQQGFPVMIKATAGGGGKGMRRVDSREALEAALPSSRREAQVAFGDDRVYLEKALVQARHLEVQVVADHHGNYFHLGVRECSLQRRHQKVLEESPPPGASDTVLTNLTQSSLNLARAVEYQSLGTVEFLVDESGYYFLEMNTRLQVEHPVTEMITGLDLVEVQLRIAQGERLNWRQEEIPFKGHAIEVRLACEDPYHEFLPSTGVVLAWSPSPQLRVDSTLETGQTISPHYDSMVAKLIAWDQDRASALRRLSNNLRHTVFLGVVSNIDFLQALLADPHVQSGCYHTSFLENQPWPIPEVTKNQLLVAAAAFVQSLGFEFGNLALPVLVEFLGQPPVMVLGQIFTIEEISHRVQWSLGQVEIDGHRFSAHAAFKEPFWWVHTPEGCCRLEVKPRFSPPTSSQVDSGGVIKAPMSATVIDILVKPGAKVEAGQALIKLEAMKMEQVLTATGPGSVVDLLASVGQFVDAGATLVTIDLLSTNGNP